MKVFIERENKEEDIDFSGSVLELLEKLDINAETVVVTKNGELITEEDPLAGDEDIKIISVVSGG